MIFGTNFIGHFALTAELLPLIQATPASRCAHTNSLTWRRLGRTRIAFVVYVRVQWAFWWGLLRNFFENNIMSRALMRLACVVGSNDGRHGLCLAVVVAFNRRSCCRLS